MVIHPLDRPLYIIRLCVRAPTRLGRHPKHLSEVKYCTCRDHPSFCSLYRCNLPKWEVLLNKSFQFDNVNNVERGYDQLDVSIQLSRPLSSPPVWRTVSFDGYPCRDTSRVRMCAFCLTYNPEGKSRHRRCGFIRFCLNIKTTVMSPQLKLSFYPKYSLH